MKRPGMTKAQKNYAREQRANLRLRRAAVALTNAVDAGHVDDQGHELEAAAFAYANTLTARDRRRLSK